MVGEPSHRISEKALKVWKIYGMITSSIFFVFSITLSVLAIKFEWPIWIIIIDVFLWFGIVYYTIFFSPKIRWQTWRYEIREQEIEIQNGLFIVKKTLIPMIRVQHVDNTQGPILKKYKLSTVTISTAATKHEIPALDEQEADELRYTISKLARVADEDV